MGLLDSIEGMASQAMAGGNQEAQVAGGFAQAVQEHPGGLGAVLQHLRNSGSPELASGQADTATPEQVQAGLGGTGLIERTAQKAGVSPQVATAVLAAVLPRIIQHFAPNGQAPDQGAMGGMMGSLLSKFL